MSIVVEGRATRPEPGDVLEWIAMRIAAMRGVARADVASDARFRELGLESVQLTALIAELSELLDRPLSPTLAWEYPTPLALANYLCGAGQTAASDQHSFTLANAEPIAIVGMSCRLPAGVETPSDLWELLSAGKSGISEVPSDRWDVDQFFDSDPSAPGKMSTRWGGFLDRIDAFDGDFFAISPREAQQMDPQQRLALELAWEALEDSAIDPHSLRGQAAGVFMGAMWSDYARLIQADPNSIDQYTPTGQDTSIISARVSYVLGLTGASLTVNSACSSSLVALHLACQSLRLGEVSLAIAGGVHVMASPWSTVGMTKFGAMNPSGQCRSFDAAADGYVRGEGGGLVILKRLSSALADGDRIYCVIRGSAANNDGPSNGLTAPSRQAQAAVLARAYQNAGVEPHSIHYVEAHGPGTILGDPIEAEALGSVHAPNRTPERALRIGTIKTNIGHLEAAAGVAGVLKTALSLHKRVLPASLNFERPNPHIPFEALRLEVQTTREDWPCPDEPPRAGVSAFGFGGTNCHVVLEALPASRRLLLPLSAASAEALQQEVQAALELLSQTRSWEDAAALCRSYAAREHPGKVRLCASGDTAAALADDLRQRQGREQPARPRLAFVCSGHGSQALGMAQQLLTSEPEFRRQISACDEVVRARYGWSVLQALTSAAEPQRTRDVHVVQLCLFSIQVALAGVLRAWGIEPDVLVGQSIGEVAAAQLAGVLDLDEAVQVLGEQSLLLRAHAEGQGGLTVVTAADAKQLAALSARATGLSVAGYNSTRSVVFAGAPDALARFEAELAGQEVWYQRVAIGYAAHSPHLQPLAAELTQQLAGLTPQRARVALRSTTREAWLEGPECDATYWAENLREPVRLQGAIRALAAQGPTVFLELSPQAILHKPLEQTLAECGAEAHVLAACSQRSHERDSLLTTLAALFEHGFSLSFPRALDAAEEVAATVPVLLSAKNNAALQAQASRLHAHALAQPELRVSDIAYSLATTRAQLEQRAAVIARDRSSLLQGLAALARGESDQSHVLGHTRAAGPLALIFSGQGSQFPGMGRELYERFDAFRSALDAACEHFDRELGRSLRAIMFAPDQGALLNATEYTQPALFALEVALFRLLESWGVEPALLMGHSFGEVVATHVAGVLSLADACTLIAARARLIGALPAGGAMIALQASEQEVLPLLAAGRGRVDIAAINGPLATVVAGEEPAALAIAEQIAGRGRKTKRLAISHAVHSPLMEDMLEPFGRVVRELDFQPPRIPIVSNLSGRLASTDELCSPDTWVKHVRQAVRFGDGMRALAAHGVTTFVELGGHGVLSSMGEDALPEEARARSAFFPLLRRDRPAVDTLMAALAGVHTRGHALSWQAVFAGSDARRVALPSYPFQRRRHWLDLKAEVAAPPQLTATNEAPAVEREAESTPPLVARVQAALPSARAALLMDHVRAVLAQVLGHEDVAAIDPHKGFFDLGMDSLMAVELRKRMERDLGRELPSTLFIDRPTLESLVPFLLTAAIGGDQVSPAQHAARVQTGEREPIAIIGMACRFPGGANDLDAFWQLLREGTDATSEVPAERWDVEAYYDPDPEAVGKMITRRAGFLQGVPVDGFDAEFFGISAREAASMDPQQRLLLEVCCEALDHAGQPVEALAGTRTALMVGLATNDYAELVREAGPESADLYAFTGNAFSVAAGRLSYVLGLEGPCMPVDTACSSSVVAVHLACQSLQSGAAQLALAGGANLLLSPNTNVCFSQGRALAPDGRCKTFDAAADGYGRGEGAGMLVLKRLSDALRDGDQVLAVLRGSATNHGGRSGGLTVPSGLAQTALLRAALADAQLDSAAVDYIEAHGTGTPLGDPIELSAIGAAIGERADDQRLRVGSVKTAIGHLEAAAGIAGIIKVVLALQHEALPPHLHLHEPSPNIPWRELPIDVPTQLSPWLRGARARIAGVSSFGISGTNAHVLIEEAPVLPPMAANPTRVELLPLSAHSPQALVALAERWHAFLSSGEAALPPVSELAYTSAVRRSQRAYRVALVGETHAELRAQLEAFLARSEPVERAAARHRGPVFVFSGQGSQWLGMGRTLLEREPTFRSAIEACAAAMADLVPWSLFDVLNGQVPLDRVDIVQPALFAMQVGLAALWRAWGIEPAAVVGHSLGEVAAAHVAGVLSLEAAARVICERSRLVADVAGTAGGMLFVELDRARAQERVAAHAERVSVGVINGPSSVVLSGERAALDQLRLEFEREGIFHRWVNVNYASHSPQMDALAPQLSAALAQLSTAPSAIPIYSTVTAELRDGAAFDAAYWARNLREPVQFWAAIQAISAAGHEAYLEISPHPVLTRSLEQGLAHAGLPGFVLGSTRSEEPEQNVLLEQLGALYEHGYNPAWRAFHPEPRRPVALPSYPWQRKRHWVRSEQKTGARAVSVATRKHALLGARLSSPRSGEELVELHTDAQALASMPALELHGLPLMAPSSLLDAVWHAGASARAGACTLSLDHAQPWSLAAASAGSQLVFTPQGDAALKFELLSRQGATWTSFACGQLAFAPDAESSPAIVPLGKVRARCREQLDAAALSRSLHDRGLGPSSATLPIEALWRGPNEALARFGSADAKLGADSLQPGALDAALRMLAVLMATRSDQNALQLAGIERMRSCGRGTVVWAHAALDSAGTADLRLLDDSGRTLVEALGLQLRAADQAFARDAARARMTRWLYALNWSSKPRPSAPSRTAAGRWLVLAGCDHVSEGLAATLRARGQEVVLARQGARAQISSHAYSLALDSVADLAWLLARCTSDDVPLSGIIHTLGLDAPNTAELTRAALHTGALDALSTIAPLTRALLDSDARAQQPLWVITRGAQPATQRSTLQLAQAPLWGLGRTFALEHPELWGGLIDLDVAPDTSELERIAAELSAPDGEDHIAYRGGTRLVARVEALAKGAVGAAPEAPHPDATYLITGGLGGIGLQVARLLVERGARHLVLLGRRGLPERDSWDGLARDHEARAAVDAVRELERLGASVRVFAADVSDAARMREVFAEASSPALRGVVHAAGIAPFVPIADTTSQQLAAALASKVDGAFILHELTRDRALDFFVMFSSAAATWGSGQNGAYSAANHFLDALAYHRRSLGLPATSLGWGAWGDSTLVTAELRHFFEQIGMGIMPAAECLGVFGELLGAAPAHVVIADIDWNRYKPMLESRRKRSLLERIQVAGAQLDAPRERGTDLVRQLKAASTAQMRRSLLESHVSARVASVLGLDASTTVGLNQGFFELGMDSIMSMQLRRKLEADLGRSLPSTLAFEHPSIDALVDHLLALLAPAATSGEPQASTLPEHAADEAELSESDIVALLANELTDLQGTQLQ